MEALIREREQVSRISHVFSDVVRPKASCIFDWAKAHVTEIGFSSGRPKSCIFHLKESADPLHLQRFAFHSSPSIPSFTFRSL